MNYKGFGKQNKEKTNIVAEKLFAKALGNHIKGNIQEAEKRYIEFIDKGFSDPRVFTNYGIILQQRGDIEKAIDLYNKSIALDPRFPEAYSSLGNIYKDLGMFEKSETMHRKAIEIKPDFADAYNNLGGTLKELKKYDLAERATLKAIEIKPDFANAYSNLGNILKDQNKLKEAEAATRKAIKINPNFINAYSNLSGILKDQNKLNEAESNIRKAINLNCKIPVLYYNLGEILKDLGRLKDAEIASIEAIKLRPDFAEAYNNLGAINKELMKMTEAEKLTRKAIEINPNYTEAHNNLGLILSELGNLIEGEKAIRNAIKINPNYAIGYNNLGSILSSLGRQKEAKENTIKAIEIKYDFAEAHNNLSNIYRESGNLKKAKYYALNAIKFKKDLTRSYYSLSTLETSEENENWKEYLFSKEILNNKKKVENIDIFFARSNLLHKDKQYIQSGKYLQEANQIKLSLYPSNCEQLIDKTKMLLDEYERRDKKLEQIINNGDYIFIVGMPRSGSTLIESIISMNSNVYDLGERNIFEESYLQWKDAQRSNNKTNLNQLYSSNIKEIYEDAKITTDKMLYNYQYAGIIATHLSNSKIIHCYRNPLDNILSIYKANFEGKGNSYACSLEDCSLVYINQDQIMDEYKKKHPSRIYSLNYDNLVRFPNKEIKDLVSWLEWDWEENYLSPHLNKRSVSTASSVQVRSPINSKSLGGWKNYKDMLKPAIDILSRTKKYNDLTK